MDFEVCLCPNEFVLHTDGIILECDVNHEARSSMPHIAVSNYICAFQISMFYDLALVERCV